MSYPGLPSESVAGPKYPGINISGRVTFSAQFTLSRSTSCAYVTFANIEAILGIHDLEIPQCLLNLDLGYRLL